MTLDTILILGGIALTGLAVAALPPRWIRSATSLFTMSNFGLRKIKRWNTTTDTLGNVLLFFSVLFCIAYPFIPLYPYLYVVLAAFAGLCALSRAAIIASHQKSAYGKVEMAFVVFFLWCTTLLGALSAFGLFNHQAFLEPVRQFVSKMEAGGWNDLFWFLTSPDLFFYLLEMGLMLLPVCVLWSQFKFMRLERTYKGANLFTYTLKMSLLLAVLFFAGWQGFTFLNEVWHIA